MLTMTPKAVVFDLDGTLLNTIDDIAYLANMVLKKYGLSTYSIDEYKYFIGEGIFNLFIKTLPPHMQNEKALLPLIQEYRDLYRTQGNQRVTIYPGIRELLDGLTTRNIPLAILSNKPDDLTQTSVSCFLSDWRFDIVLGQRPEVPIKPDPQGALEISKKMGIPPESFFYLGDTAIDMKTAVAAGMIPIGVSWGFRDRKELEENGARFIIDNPERLLDMIDH